MTRKKLRFMNLGENELSRDKMKHVMAGAGSGNIYCKNASTGYQSPCDLEDLEWCLDTCVDAWGDNCEGCAQFP